MHQTMFEAISSLNPSKAPGIDDINPAILKICADPFLLQFTHLLNKCLDSFSLLNDWKIHKITPIHKGKSHSDVANYRPISLQLCIMSKVLESNLELGDSENITVTIFSENTITIVNVSCTTRDILALV